MASFFWAEYLIWLAFCLTWFGAGIFSSQTAKRPKLLQEAPYRWLGVAGYVCLFYPVGSFLTPPLWRLSADAAWAMVGLTLLGFAFCGWARLHLGRFWSSSVTRKQGHHVVESGPYALVRHPIYTGLIVSFGALAGLDGSALGLIGAVLVIVSMWVKARLEERFLAQELGESAYGEYRARTPMLVPFLPRKTGGAAK